MYVFVFIFILLIYIILVECMVHKYNGRAFLFQEFGVVIILYFC